MRTTVHEAPCRRGRSSRPAGAPSPLRPSARSTRGPPRRARARRQPDPRRRLPPRPVRRRCAWPRRRCRARRAAAASRWRPPVVSALLRLRQRQQVVLGLDENATLRGEVHQPFERVLVGGIRLSGCACRRLRRGAGTLRAPGDPRCARSSAVARVHASDAQVEIGERVGRLPVVRGALRGRAGIPSIAASYRPRRTNFSAFFSVLVSIECHPCLAHPPASGVSRSYQRGSAA